MVIHLGSTPYSLTSLNVVCIARLIPVSGYVTYKAWVVDFADFLRLVGNHEYTEIHAPDHVDRGDSWCNSRFTSTLYSAALRVDFYIHPSVSDPVTYPGMKYTNLVFRDWIQRVNILCGLLSGVLLARVLVHP
jgi:hypothetical protein